MKYDITFYKAQIPLIKHIYDRDIQHEKMGKVISHIAVATYVPVIVVAGLIQQEYGPSEELTQIIDSINKFYHYST